MASNPYVNKVQLADGTTIMDLTPTTAVASDVASGKYFFTASGQLTLGSASGGGGGGLEYETGTWTTQEDIAKPTINFTKAHTVPPTYISFIDATGSGSITTNSNIGFEYIDWYRLIGGKVPSETTTNFSYGYAVGSYFNSKFAVTRTVVNFVLNSDAENDTAASYARYWVSNTWFKPYTNSGSRYWRTGRTYKWIAVWAPTT